LLRDLVAVKGGRCRLRCIEIEEREAISTGVSSRHAFGIVRRGTLIRQRRHSSGDHTAVDVAGPGAYVPLASAPGSGGYACSRVLLCVYPEPHYEVPVDQGQLAIDLMRLANETLARVEHIADARGRPAAAERLSALSEALPGWLGPEAPKNLRQRDLAALLGMRTETVCRVGRANARSG
jgi:hypothetical protein